MAEKSIKTIAILTSGGDSPGMNAVIRSVARTAHRNGCRVIGVQHGFAGLISEDFTELTRDDLSNIIEKGGTILNTARCSEFLTREIQKEAADICRRNEIDGVVVAGGDGSFRGAYALKEQGIRVAGVPCTIDLDIACTDYTIGFDTAINTAMEAIDKIRDTSASHERCSIIEVMGRKAGYIALWCGVASGAEEILIPELYDYNDKALIDRISEGRKRGKKHFIIVNAEGVGHSAELADRIERVTGIESRATILGYMQRGGSPSCRDRVAGTVMGERAVRALLSGYTDRVIAMKNGEYVDYSMEEAFAMTKGLPKELVDIFR